MQAEKIISIKKIGMKPTLDIEVNNKSHIFFGNGIATHNSHSLCYGITGYQCAYGKAHFPVEAYTSWLRYAQDKQKPLEEYAELVDDAKIMGIDVYPPNIIDLEVNFYTNGEIINYGISNIKGVGENTAKSVIEAIKDAENHHGKPIKQWSWYEFLVFVGNEIKKTAVEGMIVTGAFRNMNELRPKMLKEYEAFSELTKTELPWLKEHYRDYNNLADALKAIGRPRKEGGGTHDMRRASKIQSRVSLLKNPIVPYRDNPAEIANDEAKYLGIAITCSVADAKPGERWTVYCRDCLGPVLPKVIVLKVKIEEVKEITIKKGKNAGGQMAFLKLSDSSCSLSDVSCFTDQWKEFKTLLSPGRTVEIQLEKGFKDKDNRLHVKNIWAL